MRTYKLTVAYDGSRYQGWQRQVTTDNTIQFILEWSIGKLVGYRVHVDGSGRTDAGVHARGQVASVKLSKLYDTNELKESLNRYLPEDIRVIRVELVRNSFHARKSAKGKKYEYYIDCREKPDVFSRRYCYHYPEKLDIEAMREEYDGRRRFLVDGFRRLGLSCFEPLGAFYTFPCIRSTGLSSEQFCDRFLAAEKVAVIPGCAFGPGGEGYVRATYAASMHDLGEALERLERFLGSL